MNINNFKVENSRETVSTDSSSFTEKNSSYLARKFSAFSKVVTSGLIKTTYHLGAALLIGVPKMLTDKGKFFKLQIKNVSRDFSEAKKSMTSLFASKATQSHRATSVNNKESTPSDKQIEEENDSQKSQRELSTPREKEENSPSDKQIEEENDSQKSQRELSTPREKEENSPSDKQIEEENDSQKSQRELSTPSEKEENSPSDKQTEEENDSQKSQKELSTSSEKEENSPSDKQTEEENDSQKSQKELSTPSEKEENSPSDKQIEEENDSQKSQKELSTSSETGISVPKENQVEKENFDLEAEDKKILEGLSEEMPSPLVTGFLPGKTSYVTHARDGGRFGDQLSNYFSALWVSIKHKIPLLLKEFEFSNQLALSQIHEKSQLTWKPEYQNLYENTFDNCSYVWDDPIKRGDEIGWETLENYDVRTQALKNDLKEVHQEPRQYNISFYSYMADDDDEEFRSALQKLVKPIGPINYPEIPEDRLSVALHIRRGGGFDSESVQKRFPTKFPPDSFYLNSLRHIANKDPDQKLFVYIFTDHKSPGEIATKYQSELKSWGITNDVVIKCRDPSTEGYKASIMDDFFSLLKFDAMVRPHSSFSSCASAVSGPKIEIIPYEWNTSRLDKENNQLYDTEDQLVIDSWVKTRPKQGTRVEAEEESRIPEAHIKKEG